MIPNKSNFKFQELTPITGVKPYVIRFWETEFTEISPVTSDSGQKLYARKDVEAIIRIKKLLFEDKLTIPEAKAALMDSPRMMDSLAAEKDEREEDGVKQLLTEALGFIKDIKAKRNW